MCANVYILSDYFIQKLSHAPILGMCVYFFVFACVYVFFFHFQKTNLMAVSKTDNPKCEFRIETVYKSMYIYFKYLANVLAEDVTSKSEGALD